MIDFQTLHLRELCIGIFDCPHSTPKWTDAGKLVIRNMNIKSGRLDLSSPSYTDAVTFNERCKRAKPMPGDIIITREAPMGEVCIIPHGIECCLGQRMVLLKPNPSICDSGYLMYIMMSQFVQNQISWSNGTGTTVSNLRIPHLEALKIPYIEINQQRIIASTLSCLDDKIELNNRMNKTLEEMAQAIFKSWFVDFEPFQDGEFVDSELGRIPKGWRVGTAGEFYDISIGKTPPRKEPQWFSFSDNDVKWLSISDMGNCGLYIANTSECLTNEAVMKHNIKVVPNNTVLLSFKLTIGRVVITDGEMATNEAIAHFKTRNADLVEYTYFYLKAFNYQTLGSTSSIASAINSKMVKDIPFLVPDEKTLTSFHKTIIPIMERIKNNLKQVAALRDARDTILPKLMSGEIRVPLEV